MRKRKPDPDTPELQIGLGVTVHTISFHLRRIYEKLQVHRKTEAVAKALQHRLLR